MIEQGDGKVATEAPGILPLVGDLAGAAVDLAHNTVQLAACEVRVVARRLAVRLGMFFVFLVVASMGLALVLGGAAFWLSQAAGMPLWGALAAVGGAAVVLGAACAYRAIQRIGDPDIAFPGTLAEFKTDLERLGGERRRRPPEERR